MHLLMSVAASMDVKSHRIRAVLLLSIDALVVAFWQDPLCDEILWPLTDDAMRPGYQ